MLGSERKKQANTKMVRYEELGGGQMACYEDTTRNALCIGGIVLKLPNGTRWKIAVDDNGNLTTTAL